MKYIQIFIIISLLFLFYYLYRNGIFILPDDIHYNFLFLALFTSILAIICFGLSWHYTLKLIGNDFHPIISIISHNISLPGKYIPGKIWSIFGRSFAISEQYRIPLLFISYLSLWNQVQMIWFGIPLATIPLVLYISSVFVVVIIIAWFFITIILFKSAFFAKAVRIFVPKAKIIHLEHISSRKASIKLYICFFLYWLFMSTSLAFVLLSVGDKTDLLVKPFIFPLSGIIGNLAVIFPAGLGIKEGIMTTLLSHFSISVGFAATIAVIHRMILILSDLLVFAPSYFYYYMIRKKIRG